MQLCSLLSIPAETVLRLGHCSVLTAQSLQALAESLQGLAGLLQLYHKQIMDSVRPGMIRGADIINNYNNQVMNDII